MSSRVKAIIESGTLLNSMYEPNSVNCDMSIKKISDHSLEFKARHPKINFGSKKAMASYEVGEYNDDKILSLPPR